LNKLETYIALSRSMYFDILNHLGLDHDCDGQRDRQTEWPSATAHCNIRVIRALTKWVSQFNCHYRY